MTFFIYQYLNLINQKLYIGQTNNIDRRIREHKSNSFNPKSVNYNNIIHKAIRKYGYENFEISILETFDGTYDQANEREQFWIKEKHSLITENGYNILEGGNNSSRSMFSNEEIANLKTLIKNGISYNEIQKKYPVSKTFISDINRGKYFFDSSEQYPLYYYRITNDIYDALIEDLEKPELIFKELAEKYNLGESTVKKFNYGMLQPGYYQGEYPIRKITPQEYKRLLIKDYLLNTDYSKKEIVKLTNTSDETVRRVNIGKIDKEDNLTYPLR